jgi:WD40 repeat protein
MQNRNVYLSIAAVFVILLGTIFFLEAQRLSPENLDATIDARVAQANAGQDATIDARVALALASETEEDVLSTIEAQRPLVLTDVALAYPSETPRPSDTPTLVPTATSLVPQAPSLREFPGVELVESITNIGAFAVNPEGSYFAVSGGNVLRFYNLFTYELLQEYEFEAAVNQIAWAPRYNRIAAADISGKVLIWVFGEGTPMLSLETEATLTDLHWSPDGNQLITANDNQLRFWAMQGSLTKEFAVGLEPSVEWGLMIWPIAVRDNDGLFTMTVRMTEPQPFENVENPISAIDISPNGYDIAYADANNVVHIRTLNESEPRVSFDSPNPVRQIEWSADGNYLLLLEAPNQLRVRNASTGANVLNLQHSSEISTLLWSGDTYRIFVVADFIYTFELP